MILIELRQSVNKRCLLAGRIIILIASFCVEPFCQILISASGQISTPTVCSVETCSLESANYLFCRLDIKDAGHSEWCERAFYASDLARVLQVQMSEFTFRLLLPDSWKQQQIFIIFNTCYQIFLLIDKFYYRDSIIVFLMKIEGILYEGLQEYSL